MGGQSRRPAGEETAPPHVTGLRCLRCGAEHRARLDAYTCPACGPGAPAEDPGILDVRYDYDAAAAAFPAAAAEGMARYRALLPVAELPGLPAGGTPLVPAPRLARRYGLRSLWLKDDTRNPTRSLKDRATAVAVGIAARLGRRTLYCASAGNAAISLAGFCAHAGLESRVFVPARASATRLEWLRRFGAVVEVSAGDYDAAYAEAESAGRAGGWYSRNCALNPYLVEGKKTAAFEIAESLGWTVPDVVIAPVGDGCTLGALGKGFGELERIGRTGGLPRLVGVQSTTWSPMVARWRGRRPAPWEVSGTRAASIAVRTPRNARRLLGALEGSGGELVAVEDAAMERAADRLAREAGVVVELTSASTLAALERLAEAGSLAGRTAVLVLTGGRTDEEGPADQTGAAARAGAA